MSHSQSHGATNGASLEDCHANFFALTDVCGIKWAVFREDESQLHQVPSAEPASASPAPSPRTQTIYSEDQVLSSYSKCMDAEVLAVWRRVPKRALVTYTYDMSGNQITNPPQKAGDPKNFLSQRKELWVFWYGDRPEESFKKLISPKLKEVQDLGGTWENGLPYEARTLLFKALNNLIERSLVARDFVRIGKWFVQPFDGPAEAGGEDGAHSSASFMGARTHLSFSFQYFIHGESSVCASVDVRQHPPVRRLALHHLALARGQSAPVQVVLSPHGIAGTLTGTTYRRAASSSASSTDGAGAADPSVDRLLRDWRSFYPLGRNRYYCQNLHGELVAMPAAVEVLVAGVKVVYPTSYVLVSDMDHNHHFTPGEGVPKTLQTCENPSGTRHGTPVYQVEPSPFTASNHPTLEASLAASFPEMADPQSQHLLDRAELVYQDGLCINPEAQQQQAANEEQQPGGGSQILEYLSHWDFCNPAKLGKRKPGSSRRSKEGRERSARDPRSRFTSRIPFHKKMDLVEDLSWHLDHTHIMDPSHHGGSHHHMGHHTQHTGRSSERMPNSDVSSSGGGTGSAGGCNPPSMGPPGSVKNEREASALGTSINSPASLGTPVSVMTPKGPAPGSVRTPGDPPSLSLMSPHQPASNGPLTPMDTSGSSDQKPPRTPKSVPPPSYSVASPYTSIKSVERKPTDGVIKQEEFNSNVANDTICTDATDAKSENFHHPGPSVPGNSLFTASAPENVKQDPSSSLPLVLPHKRPALPDKEYEGDLKREDFLSDNVYDTKSMGHWLNHPVKRFRPSNGNGKVTERPMYRRGSQENVFLFRHGVSDEPKEANSSAPSSDSRQQNCNGVMSDVKQESPMVATLEVKSEKKLSDHERINNGGSGLDDPYEFRDGVVNGRDDQRLDDDSSDLLTVKGLKPSLADLDNLFDNSSDEQDLAADAAPTPPNSNKPADMPGEDDDVKPTITSGKVSSNSMNGKKMTQIDHASTFANDQLSKMFPTPPSIENLHHASPEDPKLEHDSQAVVPVTVKGEPSSVLSETKLLEGLETMDWSTSPAEESMAVMLASSLFAPLEGLYSDRLPTLTLSEAHLYHARSKNRQRSLQQQAQSGNSQSQSVPTPLSTPGGQHKSTAASPVPSPRSNQGPGSNYGHDVASPASAYAFNKTSTPSTSKSGPATCSGDGLADYSKAPEANSLLLNLILSDTLLNVFRDHNFDSCTLCVCTNEGNIRGRDATVYLPPSELANAGESGDAGSDDVNCSCGFSAVTNRRLAHQSGLFYEDETEVTGITEDLYYRKKASLLLLDPKGHHEDGGSNDNFAEKSTEVDTIPSPLMDLIIKQSTFYMSSHNALFKYARQYLRTAVQPTSISMVELVDGNDVIFSTLEQVKTVTTPCGEGKDNVHLQQIQSAKLDLAQKGTCLHKWALLPAHGPMCSEDIIRVMKSLQPVLNSALHSSGGISTSLRKQPPTPVSGDKAMNDKSGPAESKKPASAASSNLSVQGPLTWRQFHRMAGPATKGNTDDQCEPLPVPSVTLGYERDFLSISPLALHFWDSLGMEPFSTPRDVVYIVVAPDNEFLVGKVKRFFKNLSNVYEMCRLGKHVPYGKMVRDGILKVGKLAANKISNSETQRWFDLIGDFPTAALLKLYSQVCRHYLSPMLLSMNYDRSLLDVGSAQRSSLIDAKPPQSPMHGMGIDSGLSNNMGGLDKGFGQNVGLDDQFNKENSVNYSAGVSGAGSSVTDNLDDGDGGDPPAVVIYMVDPFSFGIDNCDLMRLSSLALLRCFQQIIPSLPDGLRNNIFLQTISLESIFELSESPTRETAPKALRGLAFSVYSQARKPLIYGKDCKTLTGFGPASNAKRFFKVNEAKTGLVRYLNQPPFVLAPPPVKKRLADNADVSTSSTSTSSSTDRSSNTLYINYCLNEDQRWLLATCSDERGELMQYNVINVEIPNKTRRKKASARRVGLKKLFDWILSVMTLSLTPWRLVVGRIGRIGQGELRGWSVLLGRKSLKRASKQLREICSWPSDVPTILSACLVSLEPDSSLRLMADQFTPDERFGQTASHCQLSTPKDGSCTHVLVFPTSATAQSSQKAFEEHQDGMGNSANDLDAFGLGDLGDLGDGTGEGDLGDFKDIFGDGWEEPDQPGSPGSPGKRNSMSQPNSPSQTGVRGAANAFKYGQEDPGERLEFLQQPLALGYLVSTAKTGPMPRWFWAACPHLEHACPVFLRSALHINQASLAAGGDDAGGFGAPPAASASSRLHSLDSSFTTDVLRYVLEGYNALSWLSLDPVTNDRNSCLPAHVQMLQQMYANFSALV